MKICLVSNLYGEFARGGAERVVEQEARALAQAGHDVVVVTGGPKRDVPKGVCLPGEPWLCPPPGTSEEVDAAYQSAIRRAAKPGEPRVIRYHAPNLYFYPEGGEHGFVTRFFWHVVDMTNAKSAETLGAILRLEKPDVVHTHNLMGLGFMIPSLLHRLGLRHVHTVHDIQLLHPSGLLPATGNPPLLSRLAMVPYVALTRRLMESPDVVIFPSKYLRELHERRGFFQKSKSVVLPNPAPDVTARKATGTAKAVFLFAGQLEPHKGIRLLLDAWQRKDFSATLEIAGGGSLEDEVRTRAGSADDVRVLGRLDRQGMREALERASWIVVPSLVIENAPAVLMEASAAGVPAVAASAGGIPEIVRDGSTGFLFVPGDIERLLAALRRAATLRPEEHGSFGTRAAEYAGRNGMSRHLAVLLDTYA